MNHSAPLNLSVGLFHQPITYSRFRQQQSRAARITFQLFTQARNIHAQIVALVFRVRTPDFPQQKPVSQYLSGVPHQKAKQIILGGCKRNFFARDSHSPVREIHNQFPRAKDRWLGMLLRMA